MFEAQPDDVTFHAAADLDEAAFRQVQANVRKRILRAFVARGHIEACDAKDMAAYAHGGGFSVDAGVRIEAPDRAGLERLLRYCARPPFAMDRLKQRGADLVYRCGKGHSEPLQSDKYPAELVLTPLELIERHRSVGAATAHTPPPLLGVLAPNSPLRAAVTVIVQVAQVLMPDVRSPATQSACTDAGMTVAVGGSGVSGVAAQPEHVLAKLIAPHSVRPLIHPIQCLGPDLVR